jgi:outer membrane protein OmpA-like peptidoglycan-associated protein
MKPSTIKIVAFLMLFCMLTTSNNILQAQISTNQTGQSMSPLLNKANIAYEDLNYSIAADRYEVYLRNTGNQSKEALSKLADCYWQMREYNDALRVYKLLYPKIDQTISKYERIRISELFARYGEYQQAAEWLKGVYGYELRAKVYNKKESLTQMKKDSIDWTVSFLNINTPYREFSPFLLNNILFFSSNKPTLAKTKAFGWDGNNYTRLWKIPVSNIDSGTINLKNESELTKNKSKGESKNIAGLYEYGDRKQKSSASNLLNNQLYIKDDSKLIGGIVKGLDKVPFNAGTISVDKNNHIYFSSNYAQADTSGLNRICLMEGIYSPSGISKIKQLSFGDDNSYSVMHPAINPDGTLLVFSSDRPFGKGGYDLYYSQRKDTNQLWDNLKTFGRNINTVGNEVFPSITANGYLYYSSDAAPGLGGLDIFKIPLQDALNGKGEPQHLSYPINSSADDFGWTQDSTGTNGYFTSDRLNNNDNLYSFNYKPVNSLKLTKLVEPIKRSESAKLFEPTKKSYIEGSVVEKESLTPIEGATVFLYEKNGNKVYVAKTDEHGKYRFPIPSTNNFTIKAYEYKYISDCLKSTAVYNSQLLDTIQNEPRDLLLDKFKVGFVWKLSNIKYGFDKSSIQPDARPILDSLVAILNSHPITVELGSHTDSRGSSIHNDRLSQDRAEAVAAYIVSKGIKAKRITAKGYGARKLLNKCADGVPCTNEEHQVNRRTEVKVTGYTTPHKKSEYIDADRFITGQKINRSALPAEFFDDCK